MGLCITSNCKLTGFPDIHIEKCEVKLFQDEINSYFKLHVILNHLQLMRLQTISIEHEYNKAYLY
jgi:hypothetical protein